MDFADADVLAYQYFLSSSPLGLSVLGRSVVWAVRPNAGLCSTSFIASFVGDVVTSSV